MVKPTLALIPAAQGDKLYSVLPSSGVGDFDFTRSGSATRINSQGLIETVSSGVSRLNYPMIDGVVKGCPHHILEPQATNLIQYSEDFSNAYWTKSDATVVSGFISPNGNTDAFKLVEGTGSSNHRIDRAITGLPNGATVTLSLYAKSSERNKVSILEVSTNTGCFFDLDNLTITNEFGGAPLSSSITELSNGWRRVSITVIIPLTSARFISHTVKDTTSVYTGDGTSGVYVYGAQLEEGSFPTSYIPNYGTSAGVTRSAETANGSGSAATFNDSEGVLMAEISALSDDADTLRWINLNNGGTSNRVAFYYRTDVNQLTYLVSSGSTQVFSTVTLSSASSFNKIAAKYKQNDFSLWINGYELITDTSGNAPVGLNELSFDNAVGGDNFYGKTKQIQYFDTALNSEDLEKLTSWVSFTDMAEAQLYSVE